METITINQQLDKLFAEWQKELQYNEAYKFTRDGLVYKYNPTWAVVSEKETFAGEEPDMIIDQTWKSASRRVAFILKDKSDGTGDDVRQWLLLQNTQGEHNRKLAGGKVGRTGFLPNLARLLYGLTIDSCFDLQGDKEKIISTWNTIPFALIESKKMAGCPTISKQEIESVLDADGEHLMKEIEILNPNILACCDAGDTQFNFITKQFDELVMQRFGKIDETNKMIIEYKYPLKPHFDCCLYYYKDLKKVVIKSFHPTRLGKAEWTIKEKVLSPFRKLLEISDIFENIQ